MPRSARTTRTAAPTPSTVPESSQFASRPFVAESASPVGDGATLPEHLRENLEQRSGFDLSKVRVHHNSREPERIGAAAYTLGKDIHLAPGEDHFLPHEAWHVVQQAQGRVRPTWQSDEMSINDEPRLEQEAERMGMKMARPFPRTDSPNRSLAAGGWQADPPSSSAVSRPLRHPNLNRAAVRQFGRGRWIGVGALIGSIVPILGTGVGALVGHYAHKAQLRRNRRRVEQQARQAHALANSDEDTTANLRRYIETARDYYQAGQYRQAHDMLFDKTAAKQWDITIALLPSDRKDPPGSTETKVINARGLPYNDDNSLIESYMKLLQDGAMSWVEGRITLPYYLPHRNYTAQHYTTIPNLAKRVLPIYLEEWMHQLQRRIRADRGLQEDTGGFLSAETAAFRASEALEHGMATGRDGTNYNEVDILAAFDDWGFDIDDIGTVDRYKERQRFWQWRRSRT